MERPAIRKRLAHEIELIRSVAGWPWLVAMTALLLFVPWMLFVGDYAEIVPAITKVLEG